MISLLKRHNVDYNNICEFIADAEVDINTADEQIEKNSRWDLRHTFSNISN
jgi:hypothetical protein